MERQGECQVRAKQIREVAILENKTCDSCKWWEPWNEVCFNGESPYCADFVNCGCEKYEEDKEIESLYGE